jgi:hypothetical protein
MDDALQHGPHASLGHHAQKSISNLSTDDNRLEYHTMQHASSATFSTRPGCDAGCSASAAPIIIMAASCKASAFMLLPPAFDLF